ncbi:hypothetical protein BKA80DRAFT_101828 [Phyllosticta citrichinensis]
MQSIRSCDGATSRQGTRRVDSATRMYHKSCLRRVWLLQATTSMSRSLSGPRCGPSWPFASGDFQRRNLQVTHPSRLGDTLPWRTKCHSENRRFYSAASIELKAVLGTPSQCWPKQEKKVNFIHLEQSHPTIEYIFGSFSVRFLRTHQSREIIRRGSCTPTFSVRIRLLRRPSTTLP